MAMRTKNLPLFTGAAREDAEATDELKDDPKLGDSGEAMRVMRSPLKN